MSVGSILSLLCLFCTVIFTIMGFVSLHNTEPAQFLFKDNINKDWVKDIKLFNREIARLWFCMALPSFMGMFVTFIWPSIGGLFVFGAVLILAISLSIYYYAMKDDYIEEDPRERRHFRRQMAGQVS